MGTPRAEFGGERRGLWQVLCGKAGNETGRLYLEEWKER